MRTDAYHCPVEIAMEAIGRRWTAVILAQLKESPRRYSELQRLVPDISDKMLTQRLREVVDDGLAAQHERASDGASVYDLTELGRTLTPALQALYDWGEVWADANNLRLIPPAAVDR